ncbi:DUF302 domain-containing protein [Nonlabens sp. Asnod3-A02]|uniref:DUF302 domain-containing protein n=1 Tax=Nonlabens sp. Asnod3-A02 TaxID=3160579 RepID=UPI0038684C94
MKFIYLILALPIIFISCNTTDKKTTPVIANSHQVNGMNYMKSNQSFDDTYQTLKTTLSNNPAIKIIAEVDHSANAGNSNIELNPAKLILFGNPKLGSPLMLENQQAGLDLPQRILVFQDSNKDVYLAYNNSTFLSQRHGLTSEETTLDKISNALAMLTKKASNSTAMESDDTQTTLNEGIITTVSKQDFDATYTTLKNTIENNPALRIFTELDHQANAQNTDIELRPTRVIIFGNPNLGSPLMDSSPTTALDLPQKMLVYENELGEVKISYNSTDFLTNRHHLKDTEKSIDKISKALQKIANTAAGL